jgi:nitrogen fixation-related uncharacterized protein
MNWTNPKSIVAIIFFLVAVGLLLLSALTALGMAGSSVCTAEEKARGLSKCDSSPLAGFLAGGMMSAVCCFPIALVAFIIGAFFWSGAKKDELRDMEIDSYKKGDKVNKKTEGI